MRRAAEEYVKLLQEGELKTQYTANLPKQDDGFDDYGARVSKKRKKKTVEDWEEEIDLGGHE